jgi:hypothetical protein
VTEKQTSRFCETLREWRVEHCLNCLNMRRDCIKRTWEAGDIYCKEYKDFIGNDVWKFVLNTGCKHFKKDPRKDVNL